MKTKTKKINWKAPVRPCRDGVAVVARVNDILHKRYLDYCEKHGVSGFKVAALALEEFLNRNA